MRAIYNHLLPALFTLLGALQGTWAAEVGPRNVPNEAVRIVDGKRVVELPPKLTAGPGRSGTPKSWESLYVIDTATGLVDCNNPYFEPKSCEPSSLGKEKRHRTYVVKVKSRWLACSSRDVEKTCFVIGGGKLMPIDTVWE